MPATIATSERTFSSLCRVKIKLRSTMTKKRLNHLMILQSKQMHWTFLQWGTTLCKQEMDWNSFFLTLLRIVERERECVYFKFRRMVNIMRMNYYTGTVIHADIYSYYNIFLKCGYYKKCEKSLQKKIILWCLWLRNWRIRSNILDSGSYLLPLCHRIRLPNVKNVPMPLQCFVNIK